MRNFQVRVSDELYDHIKSLADDQEKTVAHVLREALDVRIQSEPYARAGRNSSTGSIGTENSLAAKIDKLGQEKI